MCVSSLPLSLSLPSFSPSMHYLIRKLTFFSFFFVLCEWKVVLGKIKIGGSSSTQIEGKTNLNHENCIKQLTTQDKEQTSHTTATSPGFMKLRDSFQEIMLNHYFHQLKLTRKGCQVLTCTEKLPDSFKFPPVSKISSKSDWKLKTSTQIDTYNR
jgi:hypothetical protein